MRAVLVRIALDHCQGLVAADPFDGRKIYPRLNQMRDRRVALLHAYLDGKGVQIVSCLRMLERADPWRPGCFVKKVQAGTAPPDPYNFLDPCSYASGPKLDPENTATAKPLGHHAGLINFGFGE